MKGEFCLYSERMLFCQEQFCINCSVFQKWEAKTQELLTKCEREREKDVKAKVL